MCEVTTKQLVEEREDSETFIFPGLERILALAVPDAKSLMTSIANTRWLLKTGVTGAYAKELETQFISIKNDALVSSASNLHRMDAIPTAICVGHRKDSVWIGCPTWAEHFILLFRIRLHRDGPTMELPPVPTSMLFVARIRFSHAIANRLLPNGTATDVITNKAVLTLVDTVDQLKRCTISAGRRWIKLLLFARASGLPELCAELKTMDGKGSSVSRVASHS